MTKPLVSIIMGSNKDWPVMEETSRMLDQFNIPHEARALSAHRTPDALFKYLEQIEKDVEVIIAAAGGAAHLPGVLAGKTLLPVIGVPMTSVLDGMDSLLSIAQMPSGIPVATMAIGKAGAVNAALFATSILGMKYPNYRAAIKEYRAKQAEKILETSKLKG